ncbi:MAG: HAMP domain-containing protein, partial [Chloroflexi bacterium]|nr:HAMP domain-containing protein [Chloroflexota bacterium]
MRTKLISAFLIVVLVPLIGTGLYGNWITSKTLTDQALEATQHDLDQRAQRVQTYLTGITSDTLYLGSLLPLQALMEARRDSDVDQVDLRRQQTGEEFLRFAAAHSSVVQIRYIAENGQELVRVNSGADGVTVVPSSQLQNKSHRYYFSRTMELQPDQVFISDLDLNKELGVVEMPYRPVMRYATPLFLGDGNPAGILVVNINAQGILDVVQAEAGEKGVLALVDKQGYYVVHPDASKTWGGPSNLAHGYGLGADYPELEDVLLSGGQGVILLNEGLEPAGSPWGRAWAWAERQVLGPKRVLVYHTVRPTGASSDNMWVLLRDEPPASIFASVWSFRLTGASILIGAILAALLMAVALARRLTAPILALTQGVRRLAEGQLEGPIEVMGQDEMGELATAFNEMVAALQGNLERLTLLHQGGQDIASQLGWDEVLRAITRAVTSLVGGDYCIISFREGSDEKDVISISEGDDAWLSHRSASEVVATLQASLDENTWRALSLPHENGPAGVLCCAP